MLIVWSICRHIVLILSIPGSFPQIDELTKKFTKTADDMCKAKEKEIAAG